jgi:hypothetical protein
VAEFFFRRHRRAGYINLEAQNEGMRGQSPHSLISSAAQGPANSPQMVPAVAHCMVFDNEL